MTLRHRQGHQEEFLERAATSTKAEHADTLASWVLEHLHRLATLGDEVRADGVVVTVLQVEGVRITRLAVRADDGRDRDGTRIRWPTRPRR